AAGDSSAAAFTSARPIFLPRRDAGDATAKAMFPRGGRVGDPRLHQDRIHKSTAMLSVIIPTFNSERILVPTLAMLISGAMSGVVREVTIVDGGSTDATLHVADAAGCEVAVSSGPLGTRLNAAAAAARSPWLMFLRAGTVLDATWLEEAARFIDEAES